MKLNGQVLQWGYCLRVGKFSLVWHQYSGVYFCLQSSKCYLVEIQKVWFLAYYLSDICLTWWDSAVLRRGSSLQNSVHWKRTYLSLAKTGSGLQFACCALTGAHKNLIWIIRHHKCYQLVFPLPRTSRVQDQIEEMSCWPVVVTEIFFTLDFMS